MRIVQIDTGEPMRALIIAALACSSACEGGQDVHVRVNVNTSDGAHAYEDPPLDREPQDRPDLGPLPDIDIPDGLPDASTEIGCGYCSQSCQWIACDHSFMLMSGHEVCLVVNDELRRFVVIGQCKSNIECEELCDSEASAANDNDEPDPTIPHARRAEPF